MFQSSLNVATFKVSVKIEPIVGEYNCKIEGKFYAFGKYCLNRDPTYIPINRKARELALIFEIFFYLFK